MKLIKRNAMVFDYLWKYIHVYMRLINVYDAAINREVPGRSSPCYRFQEDDLPGTFRQYAA